MHNGDLSKESPGFVGKLRGNTRRNRFTVYDSGHSPKEMRFVSTSQARKHLRKELAAVVFEKNVSLSLKPRVMNIGIPTLDEDGEARIICPTSEGMSNHHHKHHYPYHVSPPPPHNLNRRGESGTGNARHEGSKIAIFGEQTTSI